MYYPKGGRLTVHVYSVQWIYFDSTAPLRLSAVHLEYQPLTGRKLQHLLAKHYKTQVRIPAAAMPCCSINECSTCIVFYTLCVSRPDSSVCLGILIIIPTVCTLQALFQIHTLVFGLDVLGNPVSFVRGVVEGTIDLFYEPIKVIVTV